jgi:aspartyl-tRNA(Asn)/glutamyl-tRNA(Gln) amidotransferase subunit B
MEQLGIEEVDSAEIEQLCRELLQANPKTVADLKSGKQQAIGALIGQAKKKNPNIDPSQFREVCLQLLSEFA